MGPSRLIRFAGVREVRLRRELAERLVTAAREALPVADAVVARLVLVADVALLADLDIQIAAAETELAALIPRSPFSTLTSVPGWGIVRVANYAAALGDPTRWPGPKQIYRAAGLSPMQYESAGKRRDGTISREGSVALRRALIDLGMGLWLQDPAAKAYAAGLKSRGTRGGIKGKPPPQEGETTPFTTPAVSARLEPTKGRIRCRSRYGGPQGYAVSSLAPGPSPTPQPERRQMTPPPG